MCNPLKYSHYDDFKGVTKMDIHANERINEVIKKSETAMLEFVDELRKRLEEKSITIDGIEELMLNTLNTLKKGVMRVVKNFVSD